MKWLRPAALNKCSINRMWGILSIIIAFIIFWFMFKRLRDEQQKIMQGPFTLESKPKLGNPDDTKKLLNSTNTGTLQAFVYPLQAQKSGTLTLCNPSGSANPGEPECSSGKYNLCKCVENDCSKCAHSGYVNVINISNVIRLEILAAPDASRQNAASAQLVVRTLGMSDGKQTVFQETIPLPNIPFQKWTMVTIAREGRRFDIYYNGNIVASKRTQYIVDVKTGYSSITAGDDNLIGKIALVEVFPDKLKQSDVMLYYQSHADTTGKPYLSEPMNILDHIPKCEGGDCNAGPKVRPTSPLLDWETQYY